MKSLSVQEMASVNGALSAKAACIASLVGYVGSIAGLCVVTGGTAAVLVVAGFHILDDLAAGISCGIWLDQATSEKH